MSTGFEFKITPDNLDNKQFRLKYSTVKDIYTYTHNKEIKSWKAGASNYSNMQYKLEHDWKQCYLARTSGSEKSFIEWSFNLDDLKSSGLAVDKIEIKCEHSCFESGEIKWTIKNDAENFKADLNKNQSGQNSLFSYEFSNGYFNLKPNQIGSFKLRADLAKGNGDNAWQHTQLFRQSLNDADIYLFEVNFYFK